MNTARSSCDRLSRTDPDIGGGQLGKRNAWRHAATQCEFAALPPPEGNPRAARIQLSRAQDVLHGRGVAYGWLRLTLIWIIFR